MNRKPMLSTAALFSEKAMTAEEAAFAAARAEGCTCDPEVKLVEVDGIHYGAMLHDDWCALMRRADMN